MSVLTDLGFDDFWHVARKDNSLLIGRIVGHERQIYRIQGEFGEAYATVSGRFGYLVTEASDYPCIGDFVLVRKDEYGSLVVEHCLERKSYLARKGAGIESSKQIVACNIDCVLIVQSCNKDFSIRRLERYLVQAKAGNCQAVIVLNKADLVDDLSPYSDQIPDQWDAPVFFVSAQTGDGINQLVTLIAPGKTAVLVGSSGVGKSTIINRLCPDSLIKTASIREDDQKGRHTTTSKAFYQITDGGLIIDTPGMREFGLIDSNIDDGIHFKDIIELAKDCRYRDCTHLTEPNCAVQEAIANGELDQGRLDSFRKLQREEAYIKRSTDVREQQKNKRKWKQISKLGRAHSKHKREGGG